MIDFNPVKTSALLLKTLPYLLLRAAVFGLVFVGVSLTLCVSGWLSHLVLGHPFVGILFGLGIFGGVLFLAREYLLYLIKAGHIAVLGELVEGRKVPAGQGQIQFGKSMVKQHFAQATILFGIDQLIRGVLAMITHTLFSVAAWLPIPGVSNAVGLFNRVLTVSITYVDEVILAHSFRIRTQNPWATSRHGLILYAQNYKVFLKNAVALTAMLWLLSGLIFAIFMALAATFAATTGVGGASFIAFLVALVFTWWVRATLLEPFAVTAMMQVFVRVTEGQVADPAWDRKLSNLSAKFRELGRKAHEHLGVQEGGKAVDVETETCPIST